MAKFFIMLDRDTILRRVFDINTVQEPPEIRGDLDWATRQVHKTKIDGILRHKPVLEFFIACLAGHRASDPQAPITLPNILRMLPDPLGNLNFEKTRDQKLQLLETIRLNHSTEIMSLPNIEANFTLIGNLRIKASELYKLIKEGFQTRTSSEFIQNIWDDYLNWWRQQTLTTNGPFFPPKPA